MRRSLFSILVVCAAANVFAAATDERLPEGSFTIETMPGSVFRVRNGVVERVSFDPDKKPITLVLKPLPTGEALAGLTVKTVKGYGVVRRSALMNALSQVPTDAVHIGLPSYRPGRTPNKTELLCELDFTVSAEPAAR